MGSFQWKAIGDGLKFSITFVRGMHLEIGTTCGTIISSHHVGPGCQTQVIKLDDRCLYPLSDLASREVFILKRAASAAFEPSLAVNYDYAREEFGAW